MSKESEGATAIVTVGLCLVIVFGMAAPAAAVTTTQGDDDPDPCVRVDESEPSVQVHEDCPDDGGTLPPLPG